jgi:DNA-binding CsgD family transcriptional regulator
MNEEEQAFYRHYDEHDVRAGAVWPVHDRRAGLVHVIATWTKAPPRDYLKAAAHFGSDIHIAMTWFCEALRVREMARQDPRLTLSPRERECLLWVQVGRSTKDIGDRLMLSDATVNEYIAAAMRKLGASNRVQAAARAAMLGLIRP